mmetsp:Transcript_2840/g.17671  ORF Transcript_2840/g.17671 Transcript_2840/m.17671 type:complete len:237 (+) Transcript_2840:569-1279(+)
MTSSSEHVSRSSWSPYLLRKASMCASASGKPRQSSTNAMATWESEYAAVPMLLHMASLRAASWSCRRVGRIPGESRRSSWSCTRTHRNCRVTPGRGALSQYLLPRMRLMSADFPTFGNPTATARTGRGLSPRFFLFVLISVLADAAARTRRWIPFPVLASVQNTCWPVSPKYCAHSRRSSSCIMSNRLITSSLRRCPVQSSNCGCRVARGQRASRTSNTTSTTFSCSRSCLSAFAT